ncbi:MAG: hypothetical protein ACOCZS_00830, partial [Verrucomicrobiota bacterium]
PPEMMEPFIIDNEYGDSDFGADNYYFPNPENRVPPSHQEENTVPASQGENSADRQDDEYYYEYL